MTTMKIKNKLWPLKDYVRNSIILLSGVTSFVIFLIITLYISPPGEGALSFCAPLYALIFNGANLLSLAITPLSNIIIPVGVALIFFFGLSSFFGRNRSGRRIIFLFGGLSLALIGYGFLLHGYTIASLISGGCAIICTGYASVVCTGITVPRGKANPRLYEAGFVIVMAAAALNCFYLLDYIPYHLSGWEVSNGISVLQLFQRIQPDYSKLLWSFLPRPYVGGPTCPFFVYFLAGLIKLFGVSILTIRSAGVFWGLVSLVSLYFFTKALFGRRTALLATLLTSVSPWFLSIARLGNYISMSLCYVLIVLLFFYRALEGKLSAFFFTGGLLSLFSYFYLPAKVLFPILALVWLHHWLTTPDSLRKNILKIATFLFGFFLISSLWGNPFPQLFGVAMKNVFIGSPTGQSGFNIITASIDLKRNLYSFFYNLFYSSHSTEFPAPRGQLLTHGVLLLAFLGFGWSINRWKKRSYFFISTVFLMTTLPVLLDTSNFYKYPLARRGFLLAAFIPILAAITLSAIMDTGNLLWKRAGPAMGRLVVLFFLIATATQNIYQYFNSTTHPYFIMKRSFAEQCIELLKQGYYLEIGESDYHQRELIDFLSLPLVGRLYTYYTYMPQHFTHRGDVPHFVNFRSIGENPYYNFWETNDFGEVLSRISKSGKKTAILFENETVCRNRPILTKIISSYPRSRIMELKDPEDRGIGFQVLLDD